MSRNNVASRLLSEMRSMSLTVENALVPWSEPTSSGVSRCEGDERTEVLKNEKRQDRKGEPK